MIDETLFEAEEKMEKAVEVAKEDFAGIRTGRANPGMFNKLTVNYYGAPTPLQQLASFQTPEARTIIISPFDKSSMHEIEKTLRDSDLGVNPSNDGNIIRVVLPILTEDRRRSTSSSRTTRPRRRGSRSATSAARPRPTSTSWSRTATSARTTESGARRSWSR